MVLLQLVPKDVHCVIDICLSDLEHIAIILDNMEFNCDRSNPAHVDAEHYLLNVFYPNIKNILKESRNAIGSDTQ